MKKYVITESQLKTIVEKYDQIPKEVANAAPMSFQNFMDAIEKEKEGGENDKGDLKSFVSAQMATSRAEKYLDKTDDALAKIAGKHYKPIHTRGYRLSGDDAVLADAEDLSIVIISLYYYFYKEGQLGAFKIKDVKMDLERNYNLIKAKGASDFRVLLGAKFSSDWIISLSPDVENESIVTTPSGSIQVHVNNMTKKTILVKFNFMDSTSMSTFFKDILKDPKYMSLINKAVGVNTKPRINSGSIEFLF
jgi:hypothetical protein